MSPTPTPHRAPIEGGAAWWRDGRRWWSRIPVTGHPAPTVAPQGFSLSSSIGSFLDQKRVLVIIGKMSVDANDLHGGVDVGNAQIANRTWGIKNELTKDFRGRQRLRQDWNVARVPSF